MNTIFENYQIEAFVNDLHDVAVRHAGTKHMRDLISATVNLHLDKADRKFRLVNERAWWDSPSNAKPYVQSLRAYFMAHIPMSHGALNREWAETLLDRPYPESEEDRFITTKEKILWWADADAEYRRIFADAMIKAAAR